MVRFIIGAMKTMLVSEFKAKCLAALKEVQRTREPMLITLRGRPLAIVRPAEGQARRKRLGGLKGRMTIRLDLVKADTTRDWEMLR
jgi:prevent-host-death family protein